MLNMKHSLVIDAWMREAQEAEKWVEDIESRVRGGRRIHQKAEDPEEQHQYRFSNEFDRLKLSEVGVKLDRLESLLRNPPSKPVLTDEDKEFRWKMLSDMQLRTKLLALSLYSMPSPNRKGGLPVANTNETNIYVDGCDQDQIKELSANEELELLKPLVSDDPTQSHTQIRHQSSFSLMNLLRKICWIIGVILGSAAFLSILFIICAVI